MNNYSRCESKLLDFCNYEANWNVSDSETLSVKSICSAFILLEHLPDWEPQTWDVQPVAYSEGVVQFTYRNETHYFEIDVTGAQYSVLVFETASDACVADCNFITVRKLVKFLHKIKEQI